MTFLFSRFVIIKYCCYRYGVPLSCNRWDSSEVPRQVTGQLEFIRNELKKDKFDWSTIKNNVLNMRGNINIKNLDGVLLKYMANHKIFHAAQSYIDYLKSTSDDLSLGSINGMLAFYYEFGKENKLTEVDREGILQIYKDLYNKYEVLDYATSEKLLHALCVVNEWKKAIKVLNNIQLSAVPTHSAYSTLIATLFKHNKVDLAMEFINNSLNNKRPLHDNAYNEWINYILRRYKDKKTILKYLDEICSLISRSCSTVRKVTAEKLKQTFTVFGFDSHYTHINKNSGQCLSCKEKLECLTLTEEEFINLQKNVKDKLIVGSDLFLKTSPDELRRFVSFVEQTMPYDVVLDALNIAFSVGLGSNIQKSNLLIDVVDFFKKQNKKVLLIGRKHMLRWPKRQMDIISRNTCTFFTEDISQDDPYFITAAILSGPHTDIVSRDLLRGHRFILNDDTLRQIFQRWQWQHQWMVFTGSKKYMKPQIMSPLKFTPCAQKNNGTWHLPCENEEPSMHGQVKNGIPDLSSWLCIKPNMSR